MRSDLLVSPNPQGPYPWTSANTVATDPDFGTSILRVTDETMHGGKLFMQTSSAGQCNLWNTDSTLLLVETDGGLKTVFHFDPVNFKAFVSSYTFEGQLTFSRVYPFRLYQILGTQLFVHDFRDISGLWGAPSSKLLYDFAKILPAGFVPDWVSCFECSLDDNSFSVGYSSSVQDTGHYVCNFTKQHGGKLLDTSAVTPSFLIHEVYQTPATDVVAVMGVAGARKFWHVSTNTLVDIPVTGHSVHGMLTYRTGGPGGGQWVEIPYSNPTQKRLLYSSLPTPPFTNDQHGSLNHLDTGDTNPYIVSYVNNGLVTTAWQGEILLMNPASGVVERVCHHLSLLKGGLGFDVPNAIAIESQDGRFVAFCSNLMGTISGDVFVVKLV